MNGCFLFLLVIYIFYFRLRNDLHSLVNAGYWKDALHALVQRDYLLKGLAAESRSERAVKEVLLAQIRAGSLQIKDLEAFEGFQEEADRCAKDGLGLLRTYAAHMAFALVVPSVARIFVQARFRLDLRDLAEILLSLFFLIPGLVFMFRSWPRVGFNRKGVFEDFIRAYLGVLESGPFADKLNELKRQAWEDGVDDSEARRKMMRDWYLSEIAQFKARLGWFENALGPLELFASCLFAVLLLGLPLLSHFSGLVKP